MMPAADPSATRRRPASVAAGWMVLGVAVLTLHAAGRALPAPPLGAPSEWSRWMAGRDPVAVAFGIVRLLALGAAWYGLVVTAAGVGLRLVSARRLASLVDRVTVVPLRHLVAATVVVGMSAGPMGVTGAGAEPSAEGPPPTITMHLVAPDAATESSPRPPAPTPTPTPTPTPAPAPTAPVPDAAPPPPPDASAAATGTTWTVQPGQCFWSIAESELGRIRGRRPTAAEIVPYWHRLIEANRAALADPHNADLVFPGQVFALPEP